MPFGMTIIKVEDVDRWKAAFDAHADVRKAHGEKGHQIFRVAGEPNSLIVLVEVEDMDRARTFLQSEELREAMRQAGVIGQPDIYLLDRIEQAAI